MVLLMHRDGECLAVVAIKHKGKSNFIVTALGTDGSGLLRE